MKIIKKYCFIYCITNLLDNKKYVGYHTTNKLEDLYYGSGLYIKNAINKYGLINFKKEILEFIKDADNIKIKNAENFWINKLNSKVPNGYNIADGGKGGNLGKIVSEKISKKLKGRIFTKKWGEKISKALKGKRRSVQSIEKGKFTTKLRLEQGLYKKKKMSEKGLKE